MKTFWLIWLMVMVAIWTIDLCFGYMALFIFMGCPHVYLLARNYYKADR